MPLPKLVPSQTLGRAGGIWLRNEADALEPGELHRVHRAADAAERSVDVTADMRLGHILFGDVLNAAHRLDLIFEFLDGPLEQFVRIDLRQIPIDLACTVQRSAN